MGFESHQAGMFKPLNADKGLSNAINCRLLLLSSTTEMVAVNTELNIILILIWIYYYYYAAVLTLSSHCPLLCYRVVVGHHVSRRRCRHPCWCAAVHSKRRGTMQRIAPCQNAMMLISLVPDYILILSPSLTPSHIPPTDNKPKNSPGGEQ